MSAMKVVTWGTLALTALLVRPYAVQAQGRMSSGMQDVRRVTCTFSALAAGEWHDNGVADAHVKKAPLTMSYDAIDADDGTARLNTQYGALPMIAKASIWSLHLLHTGSEGTVLLTTVFNRENRPGWFKAVHTVHELTPVGLPNFASRPEQHYGECAVERH